MKALFEQMCAELGFNASVASVEADDELIQDIQAGGKAKRAAQKLLGHHAVSEALELLGRSELARQPVERGVEGEPLWPAGIVGSSSHSYTRAVAAVSDASKIPASKLLTLGMDIERVSQKRSEKAFFKVLQPSELEAVYASERFNAPLAHQLYSLKESAYKAVYMLNGHKLKPSEVSFRIDDSDSVECLLSKELQLPVLTARTAMFEEYACAICGLVAESFSLESIPDQKDNSKQGEVTMGSC